MVKQSIINRLDEVYRKMESKKISWSKGSLLRDAILKISWIEQIKESNKVLSERRAKARYIDNTD